MEKLKACAVSDLADDTVVQFVRPDGVAVAVYQIDGEFYATDDLCSHGQAYLSEGDIEEGNIVCPFHGGMFDIKTGDPTAAPCVVPIRTYGVSVDGDDIYINAEADE